MGALIRMGALIGIGALINKNTFEGGRLFGRGAYWKEGAKSNHYTVLEKFLTQTRTFLNTNSAKKINK